jgi:hypothetical protein
MARGRIARFNRTPFQSTRPGMNTSPEFTPYLWHDNAIYGLHLEIGDPEAGDWRSNLVLDIDHIVTWTCCADDGGPFQVAPATLTFHDAGDLCIAVDCGDTGGQVALHEFSIDRITREPLHTQQICRDRPVYRWRIELNWPQGGSISFAASGFTQVLRAEAVLSVTPRLPAAQRGSSREAKPCG